MSLLQDLILDWYDLHQRSLLWRATGGDQPNPYYVWLSEVMLQQTTVVTVGPYFQRFIDKWPTLAEFAQADLADIYHAWQGLGYYSRARNLHHCAQHIVTLYDGKMPRTPEQLLTLPGIGPYTSAAIASIAFDHLILPVDGNIIRVISRIEGIETPLPQLKDQIQQWANANPPHKRAGDYAQSLMDLGATICKPRNPECPRCPIQSLCASYKDGKQDQIPVKAEKKFKPTRYAQVFLRFNEKGDVQLRQRPSTGLLANLYEFPSNPWQESTIDPLPNLLAPRLKHTFTHFHLILQIMVQKSEDLINDRCFWISPQDLDDYALPTVMRKVWDNQ